MVYLREAAKFYAKAMVDVKKKTLAEVIYNKVEKGSKINTDQFRGYDFLSKDFHREFVKHSAGEYVRGDVHTNGIENFWSHLKRGIIGTYFKTSKEHLDSYVNEFSFRYNTRDFSEGSRFDITLANSQKRLTYNELIKKGPRRA